MARYTGERCADLVIRARAIAADLPVGGSVPALKVCGALADGCWQRLPAWTGRGIGVARMSAQDHSDSAVASVGEGQTVSVGCERDEGPGNRGLGAGPAIAQAAGAAADDRVEVARGHGNAVEGAGPGRDDPDLVDADIVEDQVARAVQRQGLRPDVRGEGGRAVGAGTRVPGGAGDRVDVAGGHRDAEERPGRRRDHPDPVRVRDQQSAGADRDKGIDPFEAGVARRAAVAADAPQAARDVVDVTGGHFDAVEGAGALCHDPDLYPRADDDVAVLVDADRARDDPGLAGR